MTTLLAAALLIVSVDGLDQRYLDNPSLKIPNLRRPVTVDAPGTFNLPEYFKPRRGGSMDTLCRDIATRFPSFQQEWMDDRTRTLATRYPIQKADAVFVHLVDLNSEAHDNGSFSTEAHAIVERTYELIGEMLAALPRGGRFVLVSDHGFEKAVKSVNLLFAAAWLRQLSPDHGIGRQVPADEIVRFAPPLKGNFLFESLPGVWFGPGNNVLIAEPREAGNHGHWPTRYRSVYAAWGPGISPAHLPEMHLEEIANRLATLLRVKMERR